MFRLLCTALAGGLLLLPPARTAGAGPPVGVAYYDVDHLYDTLPALFYDDADYTPEGRLGWDAVRYGRKIRAVATTIDSMSMDLVGLWGVENEAVVRDLAAASAEDYVYLHRTLNSLDGMDFALLYRGDRFFPHYDEAGRRYLYVEGTLRRDTVGILLCSDAHTAQWLVGTLREERPAARIIALGRLAGLDAAALGLHDATARAARAGRGNLRAREGWRMRDRILADTAFAVLRGDVFVRRPMTDPATGYPQPTYDRGRYRGGAGYALPVFVYLR